MSILHTYTCRDRESQYIFIEETYSLHYTKVGSESWKPILGGKKRKKKEGRTRDTCKETYYEREFEENWVSKLAVHALSSPVAARVRGANPVQKWCSRQMHQEKAYSAKKECIRNLPFCLPAHALAKCICTTAGASLFTAQRATAGKKPVKAPARKKRKKKGSRKEE